MCRRSGSIHANSAGCFFRQVKQCQCISQLKIFCTSELSRLTELFWYMDLQKRIPCFLLLLWVLVYYAPCFANAEEQKKKKPPLKNLKNEDLIFPYISWLIDSFTYLKNIIGSRYSRFFGIRMVKNTFLIPVWVLSWCSVTAVNKICSALSHLFDFCLHIALRKCLLNDTSHNYIDVHEMNHYYGICVTASSFMIIFKVASNMLKNSL